MNERGDPILARSLRALGAALLVGALCGSIAVGLIWIRSVERRIGELELRVIADNLGLPFDELRR